MSTSSLSGLHGSATLGLFATLLLLPDSLLAQAHVGAAPPPRDTVTITAGPQYRAKPFKAFFLGQNWRDVWQAELRVPVLDLSSFAGGLTPTRRGGNQSETLRFKAADGLTYIFRSTDKFVPKALPPDVQGTPGGAIIQDQTSAMHPTGAFAVARLQDALGLLQAVPQLYVMPDDPRLGEFREDFAGMLGQIEVRPDETESGITAFAGIEKIRGSDALLEKLEESLENRIDAREYLKARLLDFMIGDTDRGADQWRWAEVERDGFEFNRPVPRDRDYAFMVSDGRLMRIVARVFPKLVVYEDDFPRLRSLVFMTSEFDRSQLVELPWAAWDSVVTEIQTSLTDPVITDAAAQLPPPHQQLSGGRIVEGLRERRDDLRNIARKYYAMVARHADVHASDEPEIAEIVRLEDGSVDVRVFRATPKQLAKPDRAPAIARRFLPDETEEIRLHLHGGNDRAVVRGSSTRDGITLRIVGGGGDDVIADSAAGGHTVIYDAHGSNQLIAGNETSIRRRAFAIAQPVAREDEGEPEASLVADAGGQPAPPASDTATSNQAGEEKDAKQEEEKPEDDVAEERRGRFQDQAVDMKDDGGDWFARKTSSRTHRDWGSGLAFSPVVDYQTGAGLVLGGGPAYTRYGFRHIPYEYRTWLRGMYAIDASGFGVEAGIEFHPENSPLGLTLRVRGTQFEANRFFGFGNETELLDNRRLALVQRDELLVQPSLDWAVSPAARFSIGPVVRYVDPSFPEDGPLGSFGEDERPLGSERFGAVGGRVEGMLDFTRGASYPRNGIAITAAASAYPAAWDAPAAFGEAHGVASAYLSIGTPVTIALRAGGKHVWGEFPLHEAAYLGGRGTLRGYRWNRFTGDASAFGSTELRLRLARIELFTRGDFGVFGLADAGRVWMNGVSEGDWHTATGGGLWFSSLGKAASIAYAKGEESRVYVQLGLPF